MSERRPGPQREAKFPDRFAGITKRVKRVSTAVAFAGAVGSTMAEGGPSAAHAETAAAHIEQTPPVQPQAIDQYSDAQYQPVPRIDSSMHRWYDPTAEVQRLTNEAGKYIGQARLLLGPTGHIPHPSVENRIYLAQLGEGLRNVRTQIQRTLDQVQSHIHDPSRKAQDGDRLRYLLQRTQESINYIEQTLRTATSQAEPPPPMTAAFTNPNISSAPSVWTNQKPEPSLLKKSAAAVSRWFKSLF